MLALRIFFNSHAGGWSLYRPYTIKSILLKTVSLNRLQFFFILDFIFTTIITSKVWKIILCLEENLFSEANFEYFRNFTRFKKIYVIIDFRVEAVLHYLRISTSCISRLVSSLFWHFQVRILILVHSLYIGDVLETFKNMWLFRGGHLTASSDFTKKSHDFKSF